MVNYMTDIALVEEDPAEAIVIEVAGTVHITVHCEHSSTLTSY